MPASFSSVSPPSKFLLNGMLLEVSIIVVKFGFDVVLSAEISVWLRVSRGVMPRLRAGLVLTSTDLSGASCSRLLLSESSSLLD